MISQHWDDVDGAEPFVTREALCAIFGKILLFIDEMRDEEFSPLHTDHVGCSGHLYLHKNCFF